MKTDPYTVRILADPMLRPLIHYQRELRFANRAELKAAVKIVSKRLSAVNRKLANLPYK